MRPSGRRGGTPRIFQRPPRKPLWPVATAARETVHAQKADRKIFAPSAPASVSSAHHAAHAKPRLRKPGGHSPGCIWAVVVSPVRGVPKIPIRLLSDFKLFTPGFNRTHNPRTSQTFPPKTMPDNFPAFFSRASSDDRRSPNLAGRGDKLLQVTSGPGSGVSAGHGCGRW